MTGTPSPAPLVGRRAANRAATVAAIKAAALRQVADEGAAALSIRGVARAVGLSPAGMYRYYDSRDALITDLLVDAYNDLADAVTRAAGLPVPGDPEARDVARTAPSVPDPLGRLAAAIGAYREWAVGSPARFLLIFGTPVPGYQAPPDGPTVAANRRMGQAFFTLAALAWRHGMLADPSGPPDQGRVRDPRPAGGVHPAEAASPAEADLLHQLRGLAPGFPSALVPRMLAGWALWHGLVTLEITGQLHWIYPDTQAYYTERVAAWVEAFAAGLT